MRTAFLVLVFANVAFFAYGFFVAERPGGPGDPTAQQIKPERVRIVPPGEVARLTASRRGAACIELGPVAATEAARAEEAVGGLAGGLKVSQRRVDDAGRWWVYLPPLPTRAAASQRVTELKSQGIDSSLINDDPAWRNAISLGVLNSEEAASRHIEDLKRRGVRGAQAAPREGRGARVYVQLRDAPEPVRLRLVELKEGFPGSDVRECPGA